MKFLPKRCELHGSFKCNSIDYGCFSWKSGSLVVDWYCNSWRISMYSGSACNNKLSYRFRLNSCMIKRIICKAQLVLELNDPGRSTIHFKLQPPGSPGASLKSMQELHSLLQDIKSGMASPEAAKGLTDFNSSSIYEATDQQFTSVKANKRSERGSKLFYDDCDDESKENMRGAINNSEKFLQRGKEKSRECLQALAASDFYSSPSQSSLFSSHGSADKTRTSTPAQGRQFGAFSVNSSIKRTPGLMPDPTPSKKLRLSDAAPSYSWQKSKSSQSSDKKQQMSLQGFSNLGNTCYMNAILQALFGLDTFASDLLSNRKIYKQMSQHSLYFSLAKLLHSRRRSASDVVRRDLLRAVKTSISTTVRRFSGYQQHDAHEFLIQVIDQLKEEVQKMCNATPSPSREDTDRESSDDSQEFLNPAVINFEFEVTHSISCLKCDEIVTKCEQFNDLSLDMPKRRDLLNRRSIQHALELFFRKEKIEYTCEKCGSNKSEVTHTFTKLPRVLILHLKRYNYDVTASRNTKMAQSIRIPEYLTLQSHCSEQTQPPHPTYWPSLLSPQKVIDSEDEKDHISRRRLDYNSGFHFKKRTTSQDSENGRLNDLNKTTPTEHNAEEKDESSVKPLALEEEVDPELARVLEMSLKEHTERQEKLDDNGENEEFERAVELSQQNDLSSTHTVSKVRVFDEKRLNELSEEEQLRLAIEQSIRESEMHYDTVTSHSETEYEQNEKFEDCHTEIETTNQNIEISQNSEGLQFPKNCKINYSCTEESNLDLNISQLNPKTETYSNECCQGPDSDLCRLKTRKSETKKLFLEDCQLLKDAKGQIRNDLNVGKKTDNGSNSDETESTVLKEKDLSNSIDFNLLYNDTDTGWICLENKENKLPNQNRSKTVSPCDGKYTRIDDETDDSDLEKDQSVVDNEKGELPYSYRLVSIVNHIGSTSIAGHYICDVHDIKKNGWFSFDDSHVSTISATDVYTKREKSGYIFFYISKEIFEDVRNHYTVMTKKKD